MICPSCEQIIPDGLTECPKCGEAIVAGRADIESMGDGSADESTGERSQSQAVAHNLEAKEPTSLSGDDVGEGDTAQTSVGANGHSAKTPQSGTTTGGSGGGQNTSEDLGPYSEGALKLMLETLRQPPNGHIPTIVVIGSTRVGKSFFLTQIVRRTQNDYQHRVIKIDLEAVDQPDESEVMTSVEGEAAEDLEAAGDEIEITRHVFIHELTKANDDGKSDKTIRLIDLPGEFFKAALDAKEKIASVRLRRVAMLYAALGAAEGIVFLVPADHAMAASPTPRDKDIAEKSAVLMGQIRQTCNMMEVAVRAHRDADEGDRGAMIADDAESVAVERAVAELVALDSGEVRERMRRDGAGRSQKPVAALFSRADLCFGVGEHRSSNGLSGQLREHDPFWCAARYLPPLVRQLKTGFEDFKIDFVTAAEGHSGGTTLAKNAFCIGELRPISWLLERIEARRRPRPQSRIPPRLRKFLLLDIGEKYRNGSRWAVEMREKADREFGHHMRDGQL